MTAELDLIRDRLSELDDAADAVLEAGMRPNTRAAFDQDWQHWERHCAAVGLPPTTVDSALLVSFVAWLARGSEHHDPQAVGTIARRLTGVLAGWKAAKLDVPYGITSRARKALEILDYQLKQANEVRGRGASPAVTIPQLRRICEALPDTTTGHRDRCLLLVGFGIAARREELANLLMSDIRPDPGGLIVNIRTGKSPREVAVKPGTHALTDPVTAWRRWLEVGAITDGHLLRKVHWRSQKVGAAGITPEAVGEAVTRAGDAAGVYDLTGHSLRSGLATEARRAGHDRKTIAAQTGHSAKSAILDRYMQIVDRWADNALTGIGL